MDYVPLFLWHLKRGPGQNSNSATLNRQEVQVELNHSTMEIEGEIFWLHPQI